MLTCDGDVIRLPWEFTLLGDETVNSIKWMYHADGRASEDVAIYVGGHFVVFPAFSNRVKVRWKSFFLLG